MQQTHWDFRIRSAISRLQDRITSLSAQELEIVEAIQFIPGLGNIVSAVRASAEYAVHGRIAVAELHRRKLPSHVASALRRYEQADLAERKARSELLEELCIYASNAKDGRTQLRR